MMFHPFDRDLLAHVALACHVARGMRFTRHALARRARPVGRRERAHRLPRDLPPRSTRSASTSATACAFTASSPNGGQAVNIIPERAAAEFSVRATDLAELERVRAIVERCARGAALACGVEVEIDARARATSDIVNNMTLARRFGAHLTALGRRARRARRERGRRLHRHGRRLARGALDPPVARDLRQGRDHLPPARVRRRARGASAAHDAMLVAAKAMALTAADVLTDPALREAVRREFEAARDGGA